jgi:hypothetical protein
MVFCRQGSGKLGKVRVARVRFENAFAFKMERLNSPPAIVIGFDFEKVDAGLAPTGDAIIVAKE